MNFNYQKICANLLNDLPQRTKDVIEARFGLKTGEKKTLEAIGKNYGITRERVRQKVEEGYLKIHPKIKNYQKVFEYFNDTLKSFGDLKKEDILLSYLGGEKSQNQIYFLLILDKNCDRISEDKDFYSFWTRKKESIELAKKVVNFALNKFQNEKKPLFLDELYRTQKENIIKVLDKKINKNTLYSYLEISKRIQKNPYDQLGLKEWPEINPHGTKEKAYLVLSKEGKPLHFTQVADQIEKLPFPSQRKTHLATVHNELIKDQRFVLIGRGLYALKEWGYESGVVKDIILKILRGENKPLSKEEIIERVLKQRVVKENTILLNLHDKDAFLRDLTGKYTINLIKEG